MEILKNHKTKIIFSILIVSSFIIYKTIFNEELEKRLDFYR
jgi:hypothetical protein